MELFNCSALNGDNIDAVFKALIEGNNINNQKYFQKGYEFTLQLIAEMNNTDR